MSISKGLVSARPSVWMFCLYNRTVTPVLWMSGLSDALQLTPEKLRGVIVGRTLSPKDSAPPAALHSCALPLAHAFIRPLEIIYVCIYVSVYVYVCTCIHTHTQVSAV